MLYRLFSVSNEFSRKCLLNSKVDLSSHPFFRLTELGSVNPPKVSSDSLNQGLEKLNNFLQPYVSDIEEEIFNSLKIDAKTLETINKNFEYNHEQYFHAKTMLLLAKANGSLLKDHEIFSKVIEMTYFGSVLHSNLRQKQDKTEGKIFCDLGKLLGGNFMMLNASIMLCELNNIRLVQLQNQIILNFSSGHYSDILENGQQSTFLRKAYLRDVSTLAMGCQGIALISNSNEDDAFDYGAHLALAHKLVKDVKESKAKCCQSPLSFPSFFSDEFPENSLSKTVDLAKAHIDAALKLSSKFKNSSDLELWASSLLAKLDD